ncbi:MAG: hypothetical protein AB8H47_08775 [Bacteroidia bacterium]
MDFSSSDIRLLYGERFFLVEPEEAIVESVPPKENAETPPKIEVSEKVIAESVPLKEKAETPPKVEVAKPEGENIPQAKVAEAIAETPASPPLPPIHLLEAGETVVWKMRPTAKFVVVLQKQEFSNRELTGLIKTQLLQAGIDPALVGFGIIADGASSVDLSTAEKAFILLFDKLGKEWPISVKSKDKTVWLLPTLQQCQQDAGATQKVLTALEAVKQLLN